MIFKVSCNQIGLSENQGDLTATQHYNTKSSQISRQLFQFRSQNIINNYQESHGTYRETLHQ